MNIINYISNQLYSEYIQTWDINIIIIIIWGEGHTVIADWAHSYKFKQITVNTITMLVWKHS